LRINLISKITIAISLILLIFMLLFAYINIATLKDMLLEAAISDADKLSETIIKTTHYEMLEDNRIRAYEMIQEVGTLQGVEHIRMINKSGHITFSTEKGEIGRLLDKKEAGCNMCHTSGETKEHASTMNRSRIFSDKRGRQVVGMAKAIYNEKSCYLSACHFHPPKQRILGVLDIIVSLENVRTLIANYRNKIIALTIVLLISISIGITFFTHRLVNRPVKNLLKQTQRIAQGDLDSFVRTGGSHDEMGDLSNAFNQMTASLKIARADLEEWAENLEAKVDARTSEIKQMQMQLIRSEKLASLGTLVAGIAHEINNPLTGLLMFANLIKINPHLTEAINNDVDVIINEAERCAKIVRGLLDFAHESIPQKKSASLSKIMEATLALIGCQSCFQNIDIIQDYQSDLPLISVDENQIQQVFINMLLNAAQSISASGSIYIKTYTEGDEYICLQITDTGAGIREEDMGKVFDPFFTTKGEKGTGLGLSVSHGIIKRHGGIIEVQSKVNKGTVLTIKLLPATQGTGFHG